MDVLFGSHADSGKENGENLSLWSLPFLTNLSRWAQVAWLGGSKFTLILATVHLVPRAAESELCYHFSSTTALDSIFRIASALCSVISGKYAARRGFTYHSFTFVIYVPNHLSSPSDL